MWHVEAILTIILAVKQCSASALHVERAAVSVTCSAKPVLPTPSSLSCGVNGTLKAPSPLDQPYVIQGTTQEAINACAYACLTNSQCKSFETTEKPAKPVHQCQHFDETLIMQTLQNKNSNNGILHYARGCFTTACVTVTISTSTMATSSASKSSSSSSQVSSTIPSIVTSTSSSGMLTQIPPSSVAPSPPPNTVATSEPPGCTNIHFNPNACFLNYYRGANFTEDPNNPGNPDPADFPPLESTSNYPSEDYCLAAQDCAYRNNASLSYKSFALYYVNPPGVWVCTRFYAQNENGMGPPAQFFNVSNSTVEQGYGYNMYMGC